MQTGIKIPLTNDTQWVIGQAERFHLMARAWHNWPSTADRMLLCASPHYFVRP